jgi:molybdenum cofactor biosynthesis enzyme MoaA
MSTDLFTKQRDREATPDFANINLLGSCNARCYFCLGRDLGELIANRHDDRIHFDSWPRFEEFLDQLRAAHVTKVYVTGQNTDALLYRFLPFLVYHLHREGFQVGLRTNGLLAPFNYYTINQCELSTGYSIQSLNPETLHQIMGWTRVPDWDTILRQTARPRVSMVVGRYNWQEFWDVLNLVKRHKHVRYFQARRISTDTR